MKNCNKKPAVKYLNEGQVVKTYKELCKILKQNVLKGDSKKAQLKEFNRYFEFIKEGKKHIITKVYDKPLPKQRKKTKNSDLKQELFTCMCNKGNISLTRTKLFECLKLVNLNYFKYFNNRKSLANKLGIKKVYIDDFYNITYTYIKNTLDRILLELEQDDLINFNKSAKLKDNNNKIHNTSMVYLSNIEEVVLSEMKMRSKSDVYLKNKFDEFKDNVIMKIGNDIIDYFYVYEISPKRIDTQNEISNVNEIIVEVLKQNVDKRHKEAKQKYNDLYTNTDEGIILNYSYETLEQRSLSSYMKNFNIIIDYLVKIGNENFS